MTVFNKIIFILILLLIVFTTLAYGAVHQPVIAVSYALIAVMLVLWALDCFRTGVFSFSSSYLQLPILGAVIYGLVQVIPIGTLPETGGVAGIPRTISLEPFVTQVNALHFFALLIFFAVALVTFGSASRLRKVAIFISVFGFAYAFFAILQSVLSPDKIYGIYGRTGTDPFGSFVSRNNFAAWIELAVALPLGLLFTGTVAKDKRLLYITAIALMGIALVVSGSRGGLVAFLAEIMFLLFLTLANRERGRGGLRIALAAGLVLAVIAGSFFVGGESSLSRLTEDQAPTGSNLSRPHIWSVTLKMIGDSMPLGVGLGAYGAAYSKFDANSGLERVEQAHNDYLQALSDAGVVGAILGIAFLFFFFRTGFRAVRTDNSYRRGLAAGAFAGTFAVLVHSIFDFPLHTTAISLMFLTLLAVLVATQTRYDDDIPNEDEKQRPARSRKQ
jgi:O-antigen ligase